MREDIAECTFLYQVPSSRSFHASNYYFTTSQTNQSTDLCTWDALMTGPNDGQLWYPSGVLSSESNLLRQQMVLLAVRQKDVSMLSS